MGYDGVFPNKSSSDANILHAMFPVTVRRLGEGLVVGRERVITKKNGTARWDIEAGEWDFTVTGSPYDNRNPLRPPARCADLTVKNSHIESQRTVVLRTYRRDGLLSQRRDVTLQSPELSLPITL